MSLYVFTRAPNDTWVETFTLTASDGVERDSFSRSVSLSDNTAIVGASGIFVVGNEGGSAYIFTKSTDNTWLEVAKLTASDGARNNRFGESVAIAGDTAIVGASGTSVVDNEGGSAYIFTRTADGAWVETAKLTASDSSQGDDFGGHVSISGDKVIVGAAMTGDTVDERGSAYVFKRAASRAWIEIAKVSAPDVAAREYFGRSVSVSGDTAIVGAIGAMVNLRQRGSIHLLGIERPQC